MAFAASNCAAVYCLVPMERDRQLLMLTNPAAGSGRSLKALQAASQVFDSMALANTTRLTDSLQHARHEARLAAAAGRTVVAVGGDGFLGAIAGEVAEAGGVLGAIPAGRGNDFARVMGIPSDPEAACRIIEGGNIKTIDMGEVNGHLFLGIASTGFDSMANYHANRTKLVRGRLAYAYGGLKALAKWKPATFKIEADEESWEMTGYSVGCANSKAYGGGMYIAPDADLQDGLLDLVTISQSSKLKFLRNLPKVFSGEHVNQETVEIRRAKSVSVSSDQDFSVYADGEEVASLPATVKTLPAVLNILSPR